MIIIATFFTGIGYASVNSILIGIDGKVTSAKQTGIYITEIDYLSSNYANVNESIINNVYQTTVDSSITLNNNPNANITYQVTIYNDTNIDYIFERIRLIKCYTNNYCDTYSNNNIQISPNIEKGYELKAKNYITFNITFSYLDTANINNTELNSTIKFIFSEANKTYLEKGTLVNSKIKTISTEEIDTTVKKVILGRYEDYSSIINWDNYESFVDEQQLGDIRLFRVTNNGKYTVYILSNNTIYANANSARMFSNLREMEEIVFENFDTSQIVDMTRMFYMFSDNTLDYSAKLKHLDLSDWDVYNVQNMRAMFGYNIELEYLNVNTWETTNCLNMGYMFQELRLLPELDITNFDTSNVTTMQGMFLGFTYSKELDLSSFDTKNVTIMTNMFEADSYHTVLEYTQRLEKIYVSDKFTIENIEDKTLPVFGKNTKLVGGNGTKYSDDKIDANYAIVDKAIYDDNGNYISGEQGYFTLK